jgi:pilus assembly protein FimV
MIAKDKAIEEANARVKELEKNVNELQQLLEVKNRELAAQQKQAETSKAAPAPVAPAATPAPVATAPASSPAATVAPASSVAATAPASSTAAEPASAVAAAPVTPPVAKPKHRVVAPPPPPPEPSLLEDLTGNPLFLPGAAALLALLAGLGVYSARRRKQKPVKSFEDSIITDSTLKSNSLFGSTGGQSVDTNNSVFNSNFVPSASQLDTNEVDPIAEADVYIAYGRDAQAEEILKEALRNQPDRHAVRVKLLEIYANRKDVRSFEILATELYSMTKGEGDDWQQAANLGAILDPGNPLYASGAGADVTSHAASLDTKTRPVDEPTLDALLETTQVKPGAEAANPLESSPYFGSTTLLADDALNIPTSPQTTINHQPEEVADLDFDLDGLELDSGVKKEAEAAAPEMPAEIAALDLDFLDKKPEPVKETPAPDLADLSFDLKDEPAAPAPVPTAAAPEILVSEAMGLDFPSAAPAAPAPKAETAKPGEPLPDLAASLDLPALQGLSDADDEQYSGSAEMATKLDLAIAYQEIGDKEGARELLEEVVKGGNAEQVDKAKGLLAKLA